MTPWTLSAPTLGVFVRQRNTRSNARSANGAWEEDLIKPTGPAPPVDLLARTDANVGGATFVRHQAVARYPALERWRISSCVRVVNTADMTVAVFEQKTPLAPSEADRRSGDGRLGRALHFSVMTTGAAPTDRRLWLFPRAWSFLSDGDLVSLCQRAVQVRND